MLTNEANNLVHSDDPFEHLTYRPAYVPPVMLNPVNNDPIDDMLTEIQRLTELTILITRDCERLETSLHRTRLACATACLVASLLLLLALNILVP